MTKVLLSGYYGYENFGDEAILAVIIDHLQRLGADITVLSHNPELTSGTYGVKSVKNFSLFALLNAINNCDVLISGGGSLLQDVTSLKSLLYYSFIIWFAKLCKKKVIIFAQGIGPLQRKLSQDIVINLLSKCDLVTVRDIKSLELLQNAGIKASLVSDPVFSVDLPRGKTENTVGIQLRAFKTLNEEFLFNLARQVAIDFGDKKIELYVFQQALDMDICLTFEKMLKTIDPQIQTEIIHSLSKNDIIIKISRLEYMIAMRFHAVLVAIKTGVKTLAINYDAKVAKLAYEAFLPLLTISVDEDFKAAFDKMRALDSETLLKFANSKSFEWNLFDPFLK